MLKNRQERYFNKEEGKGEESNELNRYGVCKIATVN